MQNRKSLGKKKRSTGEEEGKKSRRINPTRLSQEKVNSSSQRRENSFNFKESPVENAVEQRKIVPSAPKVRTVSFERSEVVADFSAVTQHKDLNVLVKIYVVILRNNLALNLSSELHFLVSLLLSRRGDCKATSDENEDVGSGISVLNEGDVSMQNILAANSKSCFYVGRLFSSIHNLVYFSVKTIEELVDVFQIFDKATLKLLAEHRHISTFSPQLQLKLTELYRNKVEKPEEFYGGNAEVNVCFISDTDNRENFPNDQSFSAFRKQRDLFYEILRIWEQKHLTSGWSFSVALGGKIRSLLSLHHEGFNCMHLARLFKSQLLSTYGKRNSVRCNGIVKSNN